MGAMEYRNKECELRFWGYFRDPKALTLDELEAQDRNT